jgi:hypothetical protein
MVSIRPITRSEPRRDPRGRPHSDRFRDPRRQVVLCLGFLPRPRDHDPAPDRPADLLVPLIRGRRAESSIRSATSSSVPTGRRRPSTSPGPRSSPGPASARRRRRSPWSSINQVRVTEWPSLTPPDVGSRRVAGIACASPPPQHFASQGFTKKGGPLVALWLHGNGTKPAGRSLAPPDGLRHGGAATRKTGVGGRGNCTQALEYTSDFVTSCLRRVGVRVARWLHGRGTTTACRGLAPTGTASQRSDPQAGGR